LLVSQRAVDDADDLISNRAELLQEKLVKV